MKPKYLKPECLFFWLIALIALIAPLFVVEVLPLLDLPNHAARFFVLANYDASPYFQQNFRIVIEPLPNLAADLIIVPLTNIFDVWTAHRIFLVISVLLFALGSHLISENETNDFSFSAIHASFLVYGWTFFHGFLSFIFGMGVLLVALGLWFRWREKPSVSKYALLAILALVANFSHLSAVAFLGLAIAATYFYEVVFSECGFRNWRSYAADAALFVLPALAFFSYVSDSSNAEKTSWDGPMEKLASFLSVFRSNDLWIDALCIAVPLILYLWLWRKGLIVFNRRNLTIAILFLTIFFWAPSVLFATNADKRIIVPGFALLITAMQLNWRDRRTQLACVSILCLLVVRQVVAAHRWIEISEVLQKDTLLFDSIEAQSKIYPLIFIEPSDEDIKLRYHLQHALHLITIKNGSLVPTLFALPGQHPLRFEPPREYAAYGHKDPNKWKSLYLDYDYVWAVHAPAEAEAELRNGAHLIAEQGPVKVWKVNR